MVLLRFPKSGFKVMIFCLFWHKSGFEVVISLDFLFKITILPILVSKWIQSNNFLFKVIIFGNFALNSRFKVTIFLITCLK